MLADEFDDDDFFTMDDGDEADDEDRHDSDYDYEVVDLSDKDQNNISTLQDENDPNHMNNIGDDLDKVEDETIDL